MNLLYDPLVRSQEKLGPLTRADQFALHSPDVSGCGRVLMTTLTCNDVIPGNKGNVVLIMLGDAL